MTRQDLAACLVFRSLDAGTPPSTLASMQRKITRVSVYSFGVGSDPCLCRNRGIAVSVLSAWSGAVDRCLKGVAAATASSTILRYENINERRRRMKSSPFLTNTKRKKEMEDRERAGRRKKADAWMSLYSS